MAATVKQSPSQLNHWLRTPATVAVLLFLAAVAVRLPYLGSFMTIDEVKWIEGAGQFLQALGNGDLARTYWHFHPGITVTWGEAAILWAWYLLGGSADLDLFVSTAMQNLPDIVGAMRLSGVLLTSFCVSGVYLLARPLLGSTPALLGAGLLGLDPFFTAHSRIVNGDAVSAGLMMLALLAFTHLWQNKRRQMAALAGVMAGLALLTKLPAPLIFPWLAILALAGFFRDRHWRFWGVALLLVGAAALATFVLLWPAMWAAPIRTLQLMYHDAFEVGELGAGHDTFFMGEISEDPGWLFYPVAIAFRLTPITTLGLGLALLWLSIGHKSISGNQRWLYWCFAGYIIFVVAAANTSPKKLDRYVMAIIPPLVMLAAMGLDRSVDWLSNRLSLPKAQLHTSLLGGILAVQLAVTLLAMPYYLTYYNPLLGGIDRAATVVPVGWGEGLEQAARYLNQLPDAETLRVSSWYSDIFNPYFQGQKASFSDDGRGQLAADYVVFYINQVQRQKPYAGLVDYFRSQTPVFAVEVAAAGHIQTRVPENAPEHRGVRWVEVYRTPAIQSASGAPEIEGVAQLLGYTAGSHARKTDPEATELTGRAVVPADLPVTLYLKVLGPLPEETTFGVGLIAADSGPVWGTWQPETPSGTWTSGSLVEWPGRLVLPPEMPAGAYKLWAALQFRNGDPIAEFAISDKDPRIQIDAGFIARP